MAVPKLGGGGGKARREKNVRSFTLPDKDRGASGKYLILPDSGYKLAWDIVSVFLLIFTVVITPLKVSFSVFEYCPAPEWCFDLFIDIFFVTDFFMNFFTAAWIKDEYGDQKLTGKLNVIACEYLKSWFTVDLLSSVPLDVVLSLAIEGCNGGHYESGESGTEGIEDANLASGMLRMVRLLRMVKLLKILRILKLRQRFNELQDSFPWLSNLRVVQLGHVALFILYLVHLLTCGFYLIGSTLYYESEQYGNMSWINNDYLDPKPTIGLTWKEVSEPYIASLYWTVTTITTVGYGDITPTAPAERVYAIICMTFGTGIFGYVIGSATVILTASKGSEEQMMHRMGKLQQFMEDKNLPLILQIKLRRHFRFYWVNALASSPDEHELLGKMSATLRQEVLRYVYKSTVGSLPIFDKFPDTDFHDQLLRCLRPLALHPGEVLIHQGAKDTDCFLVVKGLLDVLYVPNSRKPRTKHTIGFGYVEDEADSKVGSKDVGWTATWAAAIPKDLLGIPEDTSIKRPKALEMSDASSEWAKNAHRVAQSEERLVDAEPIRIRVAQLGPGDVVGEAAVLCDEFTSAVEKAMAAPPQAASPTAERTSATHPTPRRPQAKRTATVEAVQQCELFVIEGGEFVELLDKFPDVHRELVRMANERVTSLREKDKLARSARTATLLGANLMRRLLKRPVRVLDYDYREAEKKFFMQVADATFIGKTDGGKADVVTVAAARGSSPPDELSVVDDMQTRIGGNLRLLSNVFHASNKMRAAGGHFNGARGGAAASGTPSALAAEEVTRAVSDALRVHLDGPLRVLMQEVAAIRRDVDAIKQREHTPRTETLREVAAAEVTVRTVPGLSPARA